jgi:hypothetical protein
MKKNKSNLLIPLIVIVVLILVLGFVLLRDNIFSYFKPYPYALTRIKDFPKVVESTKVSQKTRTIVRSQEEYKSLMKQLFDDENKVAMPENDFSKNDLYVVTTELNDTKGYKFKVRSIVKDDAGKYEAVLERQKPGDTCVNDAVTNIAMDIVKIDKNIQEIDAEKVDKVIECK